MILISQSLTPVYPCCFKFEQFNLNCKSFLVIHLDVYYILLSVLCCVTVENLSVPGGPSLVQPALKPKLLFHLCF